MTEKKMLLPEAPASVNFKAVSSKGFDMMFTLRDADEFMLLERLLAFFTAIEEELHISPTRKPNGNGKAQPTVAQNTPAPAPQGEYFFEAETLSSETEKPPKWKIKGGRYTDWGATVYPEVLEAAGFVNLDPTKVHDMTGWTAYFEPNDKGNPKKVVNLAKV